ncbi:MAG: hypothetical protein GY938_12220 [Ketobacter sp.]|nr:hypothetical protein [Ketobacter sp.]
MMKTLTGLLISGVTAGSILLSMNATAGRYDGLTDAFNAAARNGGISDTFNSASGAGRLADKGQLTYDFNKAAARSDDAFDTPTPAPKPTWDQNPSGPGM